MNKNWLYRVLAIALVAMLALPVFAMAEEVLTDEAAAFEEAVAEVEANLEGDAEEAVANVEVDPDITVALAYDTVNLNKVLDVEDKRDMQNVYVGYAVDKDYVESVTDVKLKANKPKLIKVEGKFFSVKGKVKGGKVTVTGKVKFKGAKRARTMKSYITFDATDKYTVASAKFYFGKESKLKKSDLYKTHTYKVSMSPYEDTTSTSNGSDEDEEDVFVARWYNGEGDYIEDTTEEIADANWTYEWSNTDVAGFEDDEDNAKPTKSGTITWNEGYKVVRKKKGTSTLTIKHPTDSKKKVKAKFVVSANKNTYSVSKSQMKKFKECICSIKSIKIESNRKAIVTVWAYNGDKGDFEGGDAQISIAHGDNDPILASEDDKEIPYIKKGEFKSFEIEFTDGEIKNPGAELKYHYELSGLDTLGFVDLSTAKMSSND